MVSRAKIKNNIDTTRDNISMTVEELSSTVHYKFDLNQKIKAHPQKALIAAAAGGFLLASFSSPLGRWMMRFAFKTAIGAAGAYLSKQGIGYLTSKVKGY